jgi:hypothetical protein
MKYDTTHPQAHRLKVYLDGVYQDRCWACDDEAGWVKRYVLNPKNPKKVLAKYGQLVTEIVYGKVEVKNEADTK